MIDRIKSEWYSLSLSRIIEFDFREGEILDTRRTVRICRMMHFDYMMEYDTRDYACIWYTNRLDTKRDSNLCPTESRKKIRYRYDANFFSSSNIKVSYRSIVLFSAGKSLIKIL